MQGDTYFPKVRKMLLFDAPFKHVFGQLPRCFAGTLLLPLCLLNDPQISDRWGYAHEVHLDKCNRARDFGLECWYDVQ